MAILFRQPCSDGILKNPYPPLKHSANISCGLQPFPFPSSACSSGSTAVGKTPTTANRNLGKCGRLHCQFAQTAKRNYRQNTEAESGKPRLMFRHRILLSRQSKRQCGTHYRLPPSECRKIFYPFLKLSERKRHASNRPRPLYATEHLFRQPRRNKCASK